ncbi:hypothetical protein RUM44_002537 [Polyplax serrata]|uniref:Carboxylesterase type B domain-containing protein n=1 Tax=Polyplax serrata TaxID=468196 RepID=A0ABR1AF46_POLSC
MVTTYMIGCISLLLIIISCRAQNYYGGYPDLNKPSFRNNEYSDRLNPGDQNNYGNRPPHYNTRFQDGHNLNDHYPNFNPNYPSENYNPNDPRYKFMYGGGKVSAPGVIGGWKENLQGKFRLLSPQEKRDIFVTTSYGQIQGFQVYLYDTPDPYSQYRPGETPVEKIKGNVSVFLGIPYATPPVRDGRFKPPQPHKGWQLLQAVDFGPACPQPSRYVGEINGIRDMDEDCLYLNVYSPYTEAGVAQKYSVMFYIHGGDFYKGASNTFPGHMLAAFFDVVVVTINYRLGALGFLSTADQNSPGNYGILDQAMALKWVYDNIEFFNGDRYSITLFGPGAGAASAGLLMLAPKTKHMVDKVIAQSGAPVADWAVIRSWEMALNTSMVFGRHLGCSTDSSWKLINCLRNGRSALELGNAEFKPDVGLLAWGPVLDANFTVPRDSWFQKSFTEDDWHFLPKNPEELIKESSFKPQLKYMAGVTTQEAAYVIYNNKSLIPHFEVNEQFFEQKVRELVYQLNYTVNQDGVYEAIRYLYTYWPDPHSSTFIREQYINLISDLMYRSPSDKMTKLLLEKRVPVYLYVLNTTVEAFKLPEWRKVPHDLERVFLTGAPFMDVEFFPKSENWQRNMWTENDRNMSYFFMKAYSDFAKFGNPSQQQILGLHFESARLGDLKYLNVNTTFNSSIMYNYRQTECAFWYSYLPTIVGTYFTTYRPYYDFWWDAREELQIAFWSIISLSVLLIILVLTCCVLWRRAKRNSDQYYGINLIHKEDDEGVDGVDNDTSRSTNNIYEFREMPAAAPSKRPPAGTPPPVFKSRPTSLSLSSQQSIMIEEKKPPGGGHLLSKSTGNFQGVDKSKVFANKNVSLDPDPKMKDSKRSYSTPSLRSNSSRESLRDDDVRMVPGSQKAIRRNPRRLDRVPQTQV